MSWHSEHSLSCSHGVASESRISLTADPALVHDELAHHSTTESEMKVIEENHLRREEAKARQLLAHNQTESGQPPLPNFTNQLTKKQTNTLAVPAVKAIPAVQLCIHTADKNADTLSEVTKFEDFEKEKILSHTAKEKVVDISEFSGLETTERKSIEPNTRPELIVTTDDTAIVHVLSPRSSKPSSSLPGSVQMCSADAISPPLELRTHRLLSPPSAFRQPAFLGANHDKDLFAKTVDAQTTASSSSDRHSLRSTLSPSQHTLINIANPAADSQIYIRANSPIFPRWQRVRTSSSTSSPFSSSSSSSSASSPSSVHNLPGASFSFIFGGRPAIPLPLFASPELLCKYMRGATKDFDNASEGRGSDGAVGQNSSSQTDVDMRKDEEKYRAAEDKKEEDNQYLDPATGKLSRPPYDSQPASSSSSIDSDDVTWTSYISNLQSSSSAIFQPALFQQSHFLPRHHVHSSVDTLQTKSSCADGNFPRLSPPSWLWLLKSSTRFFGDVILFALANALFVSVAVTLLLYYTVMKDLGITFNTTYSQASAAFSRPADWLGAATYTIMSTLVLFVPLVQAYILFGTVPKLVSRTNYVLVAVATLFFLLIAHSTGVSSAVNITIYMFLSINIFNAIMLSHRARPNQKPPSNRVVPLAHLEDVDADASSQSSNAADCTWSSFSWIGFICLIIPQLMLGISALLTVVVVEPFYIASGSGTQQLIVMFLMPCISVLAYIVLRITSYNLTHVHAGRVWVLQSGTLITFIVTSRIMVAGLHTLAQVATASLFQAVVNVVARLTMKMRDRFGFMVLFQKHPPQHYFDDPRKWRMVGDWILQDLMIETVSILVATSYVIFVRSAYLGESVGDFIGSVLISFVVQLIIETVFGVASCMLEQRIGIAVFAVWQRRKWMFMGYIAYIELIGTLIASFSTLIIIKANLTD